MRKMESAARPVEPIDAVVLAGSVNRIPLYRGNPPGFKALVEMRGRPLISYVLDALHESRYVDRIVVVGAPQVLKYAGKWPRVDLVHEGHSLVRNAWRGLRAARTERVLFCNPDQPLLRTEMVDDFVERAAGVEADLATSWVRASSFGPYAEVGEHKIARFGDDRYAHGNLFLAKREFPDMPAVRNRFDRLYGARKNNLKFALALGPMLFGRFLVSWVTRCLPSLQETLEIGGSSFGLKVAAVISPYPEITLDIDEPEDYAAADEHLTRLQRELLRVA
jgi:CTP:molybdopterin cytidylyltransferase MocA